MNGLVAAFQTVLDVSWRSSLFIVAALAVRAILGRRIPAAFLCWAWLAVSLRLVAPLSFPTPWSPFGPVNFDPQVSAAASRSGTTAATSAWTIRNPSPAPPSVNRGDPGQLAALLWIGGVVGLGVVQLRSHLRFQRALRQSRPTSLKLPGLSGRSVSMQITDLVSGPTLHGIFRPQLLFPPGFVERLAPSELRLILAHEFAHQRRRDLLGQFFLRSVAVLHWFNPLVWLLARVAREDGELACDEFVLRKLNPGVHVSYGEILLKVATLGGSHERVAPGLGILGSKPQIKRRIHMIVHPCSPTPWRTAMSAGALLLVAAVSLTRETSAQPAAPTPEPKASPVYTRINFDEIDRAIDAVIRDQFDNDRSKFLSYLRSRELKLEDYRNEVSERLYRERAARENGAPSAPFGETVRLRLIQLKRSQGETDAMLAEKTNAIVGRLKNGESFSAVAMEVDQSARRSQGGDWGWIRPTDIGNEHRDKVFALKPGEFSGPVSTPDGYLIFFAEERR
jgi:bla regulator protein BlaR1